jgi:hypothetical protein
VRRLLLLGLVSLGCAAHANAATTAGAPTIAVAAESGIVLVDPVRGERTLVAGTVPGDRAPALAPDGRRLAFSSARTGNAEIWVLDLWTGALARLTKNQASDTAPAWSPHGASLAWASGRPGSFDVHVMRADGGHKRRVVAGPPNQTEPDWSPDGSSLVFSSNERGDADLWMVPAAGGTATPLADLPGDQVRPVFSPGGRSIAFAHVTTAGAVVATMPAAGGEPRVVATGSAGTSAPAWAPGAARLALVASRGGARAVRAVATAGGRPEPLAGVGRGDGDPDWGFLSVLTGPAPRAGERLPDLDQRAPRGLIVHREGPRVALGFASAVDNVGAGPLRIRGVRGPGKAIMRAHQLVELRGGGISVYQDVGALRYTPHPPHFHWHFAPFERYELRRADDHALVGRDRKSGFCLADHYGHAARRVAAFAAPRFLGDCGKGQRELRRVDQGSSPGYTDRYPAFFHGQSIDVTDVEPGLYVLVHRANPDLLTHELRYDNNVASVLIRLSRPRARGALPRVRVLAVCERRERCGPPRDPRI